MTVIVCSPEELERLREKYAWREDAKVTSKKEEMTPKRPSPMKGKTHSQLTRERMAAARRRANSPELLQFYRENIRRNSCPKEKKARGEANGATKLTAAQVLEIRAHYVPGKFGYRRLAAKFGLPFQTVCNIVSRRTWAHLKVMEPIKPITPSSAPSSGRSTAGCAASPSSSSRRR